MDKSNSKEIIQRIFEYDNYRIFLNDYFLAKKRENKYFSQRYFTNKAGFNAHNFCTFVVTGKRNLSANSIQKIIKGIGLRGKNASFFETLVFLNQAKSISDKEQYYNKLKKIGKNTQFYKLNKNQFFFYEKWYYPVIRELMVHSDWDENYTKLAKMVRPPISTMEAQEAVELLLSSGMVKKSESKHYKLHNDFVTSKDVPIYIKKKSRRDVLLKGIESIDQIDPSEKYIAYSTVTMSKALYNEIKEMFDEMREKILSRVADDKNPQEVYEVIFQVFPVSNISGNTNKREANNES